MPSMKKPMKQTSKKKTPFMGKESMKEESMEKGKIPAFKKGGKVRKGC